MRPFLVLTLITLLACQTVASQLHADSTRTSFAAMRVVPLKNGLNDVDLDGDGRPDAVFVAWRENGNAHGFDSFTFFVSYVEQYSPHRKWYLVPFTDQKGLSTADYYRTEGGADCALSDLRLVRSQRFTDPVVLIIGHREFGQTYADSAPVTFVVYDLVRDTSGTVGPQPFFFRPRRTIHGRKKYCDINDAFAGELGLGADVHEEF